MSVTHPHVPKALADDSEPGASPSSSAVAAGFELTDDCPVRDVLDRVGDKWSVLIIVHLGRQPYRFGELHRAVEGISQRMLTLTLRALVRDGLVSRTPYATVPPRVDYELTELGRTLLIPLSALNTWATTHRDAIRTARERHDREAGAADS
ncbi:helix-turn-helix domain-containing protein [Sphaerisporangium sp. TRM90804]|uniref:winged helix-turn-helix transcriptional regulator n=1 Tax=Sphaerisporangium sp. TRM90804 TaxID=3031113 RepID=UPI00244B1171|nr:helix-turn-helix domain-containing protein [Sphaerisporangium sp. TRM90804]MDH2427028.1 helix-turn-helix domain-containing protein [Sphaerisporangium sp. TRM90804]